MDDWKNNRFGRESDYSALDDVQDWAFSAGVVSVLLVAAGSAGLLLWSLWGVL